MIAIWQGVTQWMMTWNTDLFVLRYNSVSYIFLLLRLCILNEKDALLCILFANWHSPNTLTEAFFMLFPQL